MDQGLLFEEIETHLALSDSNAIVFRDAMAEPHDSGLADSPAPRFTFGKEVYHYLRGAHPRAEIEALEMTSHDIWRFGVMTSMSQSLDGEVDRAAIEELARLARYAVVSVWKGDGDAVWVLS
jgi:hypothetical protein